MQRYAIGQSSLELVEGNIVTQDTEAIANAANGGLLGGGGVDGAIHRAAGPELLEACREVKKSLPGGRLATGGAVLTRGFKLPARYVIHCVGPVYDHAGAEAPRLLASCYREALRLCLQQGISSISFPSISTGVYGYPLHEAAQVALAQVRDFVVEHGAPKLVRFVLFGLDAFQAYEEAVRRARVGGEF